MLRLTLLTLILLFSHPPKGKRYFIISGDVSCKACVIQLHTYLEKRVKRENLLVAFRDKGHFILNESSVNYYKSELPAARFVFLKEESFFPKKEKYPYLLTILKNDTVKIPYDSLFFGQDLNTRFLH